MSLTSWCLWEASVLWSSKFKPVEMNSDICWDEFWNFAFKKSTVSCMFDCWTERCFVQWQKISWYLAYFLQKCYLFVIVFQWITSFIWSRIILFHDVCLTCLILACTELKGHWFLFVFVFFNIFSGYMARWCSGRALDLRSRGRRFDSRPVHCWVATPGKLFTTMCLCHQAV